jgi:hypothetical protein
MLDAFFLLSSGEQNERIAFIQHFHMNLDYKARALLQTVKGIVFIRLIKRQHTQ